jgi:hypothetical protein
MSDALDTPDPRDAPRLPRVDSPPAEDVLEDVPSKEDVVAGAESREAIVEEQPGVDEILGRDEG